MTNMPIKRFADQLYKQGKLSEYMQLLVDNFNVAAAKGVMCTNTISVSYDGSLYDCDFNQQLGIAAGSGAPKDIFELQSLGDLQQRAVAPAGVPFAPLAAGFPAAVLSELRVYAEWAADIKNTHRYEPPAFGMTRKADGASARPDARTVAASGGGRTRRIDRLSRRSTSRRARAQTQRGQYCSTPEPPCSSPT